MQNNRFSRCLEQEAPLSLEISHWCQRILSADTLEEKLLSPKQLTDHDPGRAIFWKEPVRPPGMGFQRHTKEQKLPSFREHHDSDKRAVCLHRFAGHELLAVEIMAYALLAFPDAPKHFRKGVAHTLQEEQEHVRLYVQRLHEMGVRFGDLPLYKHFWKHTPFLTCPLKYVSVMSLTFEMANLDFAPLYETSFAKQGDHESAIILQKILQDEIAHVSFGMHWLKKMQTPNQDLWQVWREHTPDLLPLHRAKGPVLQTAHRRAAGIPDSWIEQIANS